MPQKQEYVFLSAGKFMPGMEKLAGELFFPTNQQLFLTTEGSKNSWFQGKKKFFHQLFHARHKFASLEDKFSLLLAATSLAPLTQTILLLHFAGFFFIMPLKISLISWPIGRPPAERRGVQGGDPPAKAKRLLLKYCKKRVTSTWWQQIGVSLRFLGD